MRIALCLEYPVGQHGGTEVLVSELVHGLCARHSVVLVSPDSAASLEKSPVAHGVVQHISWETEPATAARGRLLAERLAKYRPDIIHFHLGGNYGWRSRSASRCPVVHAARTGIPCLSTNHGAFSVVDGYCGEQRSLAVKLALLPWAWLNKQRVVARLACEVAVSQNDYRNLCRWYPLLRRRFRWIYHSRIRETAPPPFNPAREKIILCAGTIGLRKGQTILVEAFRRLAPDFPDWRLILVGRVGDREMARQITSVIDANRLERQIEMAGTVSDAELRQRLSQAAIFTMPSLYEGLGLSLQEAQFHGCACIGTRCGGVTDLIEDGDNGLLVPPGKVAPMTLALERLMRDPALREQLSRRSPVSVLEKKMTSGHMVSAYEELYAGILRGQLPAPPVGPLATALSSTS